MKIVVLNGSPKGNTSVTMQYVKYLQNQFSSHSFVVRNVGQQWRQWEENSSAFKQLLIEVGSADLVCWAYPVYYFLVPANYKRFIEQIFEHQETSTFQGKWAVVLTTSIHFFDHTSHNYMQAICEDLGMKFLGSYSADMYDLLMPTERERFALFFSNIVDRVHQKANPSRVFPPLGFRKFCFEPSPSPQKVNPNNKKIFLVHDALPKETNLLGMIDSCRSVCSQPMEVVNLHDLKIKGSCLGCIQCGYDNRCVYEGQDAFGDFYNRQIRTADILLWAGKLHDRFLSSRWKMFFDRSFFMGHTPTLRGKQIGMIISGPLGQNQNLRQILEAYAQMQEANLVGMVSDDVGNSTEITQRLHNLVEDAVRFSEQGFSNPRTFLYVGGRKLFRDEIFGRLRFPFRADHLSYKKNGFYNFPQQKLKSRIANQFLLWFSKIPSVRKEIYKKRMREEMIKPLKKILEKNHGER